MKSHARVVRAEDLGNDIVCKKATSKKVTFQGG